MVGLAVAVGGLALSSITSSVGGGGGPSRAPAEVKQLLDRVPEPLPVVRKAQQAATQVAAKGKESCRIGSAATTMKSSASAMQIISKLSAKV